MNKTRFWKFLIVGVFLGLLEDIIAIVFATDASITPQVLIVVLLVAVPFAFVSEFVVRHPSLWKWVQGKEKKSS